MFSKTPYEKENSHELIMAVKLGDIKAVTKYLKVNRYLVYDFDHVLEKINNVR